MKIIAIPKSTKTTQTLVLPYPLPAPSYDRVMVDRVEVNDSDKHWSFLVYGIPVGSDQPAPLVIQTLHRGVVRVERMTVTYDEIEATCAALGFTAGKVSLPIIQAAAMAQLNDLLTGEPPVVEPVE